VGGGIRSSNTAGNLESFVETIGFPVVYSLMGWDAYCGEKYRVGFIGSYGNRWANFALSECDLLIVLGSRLDVRQTGAQTDVFAKDKTIFHIDCIEDEINNRVKNCVAVNVSLKKFLCDGTAWFKKQDEPINCPIRWLDQIEQLKQKYSDLDEIESSNNINPNFLLRELSKKANSSINYVTDVGQHQMWAAQSIIPKKGQRFVTSGGMGAMGFALPTSIGIHIGSGNPVILIAGDGGFQCNIQELETISKHNFPIKMLVLNNNSLGMVRQFQEAYFDNRYQSTVWGYSAPSFVKVSSAYGIQSSYLQNQEQIEEKLNWFVEGEVPKLLEVNINTETPVNPKLTYGQPLSSMTPPKV
jgi:acetolactate synthase-1/2/3 large subunit